MPATETKRLFIAVFPSAPIVEGVKGAIEVLAQRIPPESVRWTAPEKIHLTLSFLGNVDCARILELQVALREACEAHRPHTVCASGLGCFPKPTRPQVLWVGITGDVQPIQNLKKSIDMEFSMLGFVLEKRAFHPHLTIGRAAKSNRGALKQIAQALKQNDEREFGQWQIESVDLMESTLSPLGASYITIDTVPLKAL